MSEHQGLPVAGYRPQSEVKIAAVNHNKQLEERVLRFFDQLKEEPQVDQRWLALARTQIEQGFMAANRSIFQPGRVVLPEDNTQAPS